MRAEIIILNSKDRKHIRQALNEQFGIESIPNNLVYFCLNKKERVYACSKELFDLDFHALRVNAFGLYFGTYMPDGFCLSIEGVQMLGKKAKKNIYEISKEMRDDYLKGADLPCDIEEFQENYVFIKYKDDFIDMAKVKKGNIKNNLPKPRKLKKVFNPNEETEEINTCNTC